METTADRTRSAHALHPLKTCWRCHTRGAHCPRCGACRYGDLDGCDECGYASPRLREALGHQEAA